MHKKTKKAVVIDVIKNISKEKDGVFMLPERFVELLSSNGRYRDNGPWNCSYKNLSKNLRLFSCWTQDMLNDKRFHDYKLLRHCRGLKFNSEFQIDGLPGHPYDDKVFLLTNQFGAGNNGGNLATFCDLISEYEKRAELQNPLLTPEDKTYLREASRASSKNDKSPLVGDKSRNLIVFGAPGTGKSRYLNGLLLKKYGELEDESEGANDRADKPYFVDFERVTFYPMYSYAQFVGSYKPYMAEVDKEGFEPQPTDVKRRKVIAYKFEPGPFLRILVKAIKDPGRNYLLVIEEINRANAAAVFGDMFQLLDRCEEGNGYEIGRSEYGITPSEDVQRYLSENEVPNPSELRIPGNLYIWATMNSADQGVFPLDTAFKRRWDFKYLSLDDKKDNDKIEVECGTDGLCKWGDLRKAINSLLARNRVNEDKHLSAYFVKPDGVGRISGERFKMKVLMYLWEDAARMCRTQIFNKNIKTFSELMRGWDSVKPSSTDAEDKPLGGDNPLESIFCFGTEKIETIVVTKDEQAKDEDDEANEAEDGQETPEGQDDETDNAQAEVGNGGETSPASSIVDDDSKVTDAATPNQAGDAKKNGGGQA